jgi:hypothetical protein
MHSLLRGWGNGVLSFMCKEFRGEAGTASSYHRDKTSIFGYPDRGLHFTFHLRVAGALFAKWRSKRLANGRRGIFDVTFEI